MLEKIKENPRLVVAALITAGVLALVISSGSNKTDDNTEKTNETTQSETTAENTDDNQTTQPSTVQDPIGSTPAAGAVQVSSEDSIYKSTVRKGDNQTVIVRQMVNEYLADNSKSLSREQRLFIETNLVNKLPKDDTIFEGEVVEVPSTVVGELVAASEQLSDVQKSLWTKYL